MAGGKRFTPPVSARLPDVESDRVRRNIDERITQLQKIPIVGGFLIRGVKLEDGVSTPVHHGLGRVPVVMHGIPYALSGTPTTGHIRDRTRGQTEHDSKQYVVLRADDWGVTMYVDLWVF